MIVTKQCTDESLNSDDPDKDQVGITENKKAMLLFFLQLLCGVLSTITIRFAISHEIFLAGMFPPLPFIDSMN